MSGKDGKWSIAAVLKTVELQGSGGSNPLFPQKTAGKSVRRGAGIEGDSWEDLLVAFRVFIFYAVPAEGVPGI